MLSFGGLELWEEKGELQAFCIHLEAGVNAKDVVMRNEDEESVLDDAEPWSKLC